MPSAEKFVLHVVLIWLQYSQQDIIGFN